MSDVGLPSGWVRTKFSEIGDVVSGATPKTSVAEYWDGDIPWITPDDLSKFPAKITRSGRRFLTQSGYDACSTRRVPTGSVLFSSRAPIGYVTIAGESLCTNQGFKTIVPAVGISSDYLYWYLQFVTPDISARASGTTFKEISAKAFAETEIDLPPLAEQHRIVEALEDQLSRLDAADASVANARRRMRPLVSAILNKVVLGLPLGRDILSGATWDSQNLLAGFHSKRFNYSSLATLPHGWFWRRASDVCELINSGSTPKAHLMHSGNGEVPFLKVYNITQDGRVDFTIKPTFIDSATHENQLKRSRVRPGDVLTNIVGPPLGKTAVVPEQYPEWNINQAIVAFRAGPEIHPAWLALALRSPYVLGMLQRTSKATAGQFNVALSTCRELPLPVPPIDTQKGLITQATELLEASDRLAAQVAPLTTRSEHMRRAILRRAFTGSLVPQNPNDEPASVLLDRIRTERVTHGGSKTKRTPRRSRKTAGDAPPPPPPSTTEVPTATTAVQQELPL
ncbi:restriction endonuclease subunit S [Streptomyces sp. NPDC001508]|uniref:restriction endonuclease subunit S n=1 Tax=Streptomyces sp. NPDC001508 TaxID=3154656 RepID=UPI00332679A3